MHDVQKESCLFVLDDRPGSANENDRFRDAPFKPIAFAKRAALLARGLLRATPSMLVM
jgi:hypothetical protein